jgi:SAM-dependent methyltransferase
MAHPDDTHDRYAIAWQSYWSAAPVAPGGPLWDGDPADAAALDLPRFLPFIEPGLPLVDVGCGNGTQTRYLAAHHPRVIGVDVSAAAIERARAAGGGAQYLVLDLFDAPAVTAVHERLGDANIYLRTVLHQILPHHRPAFAAGVRALLGDRGWLYLVELSPDADTYFAALAAAGQTPPDLRNVARHGIVPGGVTPDEVRTLLGADRYTVVGHGPAVVVTTHVLPDGQPARVPAFHLTLRPTPRR